ncbi:MAG: glycerate kinase [Atopobiaceae bacterium]|nr:glycerate kinase [Atopobiaceae bacterium]
MSGTSDHLHGLFASDSFKGSLSSGDFARIMGEELGRIWPGATSSSLFVGDGGEGTLEAIVASTGGATERVTVQGPYGEPLEADIVVTGDGRAVLEAASATGLPLVPSEKRDPALTSNFGVGQLILAALDRGCRDITLGVGGSSTNDGGMSCLRALGVRFLDEDGNELAGTGADLGRVRSVDASGMDPRIAECSFRVMCDVSNPLFGPHGATHTFGPQKGGTPEQLDALDRDMERYARIVAETLGEDLSSVPGTGAAGGLSFGLLAFCGAELMPGIECVLDLIGFDAAAREADLVVTGEGHLDAQTAGGKVIFGVAKHAMELGVPCVAVVGGLDPEVDLAELPGLRAVIPCVGDITDVEHALAPAAAELNLRRAAQRLFSLLRLGGTLPSA